MKRNRGMFKGIIYASLGIVITLSAFYGSSSIMTQHLLPGITHLVIWLCFFVGEIGVVLLGIGALAIAKSTK